MHSSNPSPTPDPEDAWLEKLLRQPADARTSRDDAAAFTGRVLTALPPPASVTQRAARQRRLFLIGAAATLGSGVAWLCGGTAMMESVLEFAHLVTSAAAQANTSSAVTVEILAGVSALAMLWFAGLRDLRRLF